MFHNIMGFYYFILFVTFYFYSKTVCVSLEEAEGWLDRIPLPPLTDV